MVNLWLMDNNASWLLIVVIWKVLKSCGIRKSPICEPPGDADLLGVSLSHGGSQSSPLLVISILSHGHPWLEWFGPYVVTLILDKTDVQTYNHNTCLWLVLSKSYPVMVCYYPSFCVMITSLGITSRKRTNDCVLEQLINFRDYNSQSKTRTTFRIRARPFLMYRSTLQLRLKKRIHKVVTRGRWQLVHLNFIRVSCKLNCHILSYIQYQYILLYDIIPNILWTALDSYKEDNLESALRKISDGASLCFLFSFQVHLSTSDALHRVAVKWMLGYVGMQGGTSLVLPVLPFQFFLPLLDNAPWIRLRNNNSKLERSALQWCHKQDGVLTSKIVNIQQHCNFHGESDDSMWDMWVWGHSEPV